MTGITACGVYVKSSVLRTLGAPGFKDLDGTWEGMTRWWEENQGREFQEVLGRSGQSIKGQRRVKANTEVKCLSEKTSSENIVSTLPGQVVEGKGEKAET